MARHSVANEMQMCEWNELVNNLQKLQHIYIRVHTAAANVANWYYCLCMFICTDRKRQQQHQQMLYCLTIWRASQIKWNFLFTIQTANDKLRLNWYWILDWLTARKLFLSFEWASTYFLEITNFDNKITTAFAFWPTSNGFNW